MVLTAIDDPVASTRIWKYCKKLKIPANIADVPPECDFYFGSVHRDGPLQIMVSTNGNGPRIAAALRKRIANMLPEGTGASIAKVGQLRRKLRQRVPGTGTQDIQRRMAWMSRVCDEWGTAELGGMDEQDMAELVSYFESGEVPSLQELRLGTSDRRREGVMWEWDLDGGFGFAV